MESDIYQRIPHRPPFLWIDNVVSLEEDRIVAEKFLSPDLELYKGHYPDYPITPGVILCEAVFQAGALLIAEKLAGKSLEKLGVPVLTRIYGAKFKRPVFPGAIIRLDVRLSEELSSVWVLKGKVLSAGKTVVSVEFACTLMPEKDV